MDPKTETILGAILLCVVIWVIVREVLRVSWLRSQRWMAKCERHRNQFGELRTRLMALARNRKVNVRSRRFSSLYGGLTTLMRNPHEYESAAKQLLATPLNVQKDSEKPSRDEAKLYIDLGQRLDHLCRDYDGRYR